MTRKGSEVRILSFPPSLDLHHAELSMQQITDRIKERFLLAKSEGRAAFVSYVCAGDPDQETSLLICQQLIQSGVDILELGMPFSDPLADGSTNQLAAERALRSGATQESVFKLVRKIRQFSNIPIVLYTYYNLVFSTGLQTFAQISKEAGVDGVLILDLPPEEAKDWLLESEKQNLSTIFIIAPTTPTQRIEKIVTHASGFVYYVSREGVTGEQENMASGIAENVRAIKQCTDLPVAVGFGISTENHVRLVAESADGVVVGSTLVKCIEENLDQKSKIPEVLRAKLESLRKGL